MKVTEILKDSAASVACHEASKQLKGDPVPGKAGDEVFISYAWKEKSQEVTDALEEALAKSGVKVIRDKCAMPYKASIRDFMRRLGRGKAVVVLSRAYLESPYCMYELVEIANHKMFRDSVFPIVLPDANLFSVEAIVDYVKYWEGRIKNLDGKMREVELSNLQGIQNEINSYRQIRSMVAEILDVLRDMNVHSLESHSESGFKEIISAIENRLSL